MKKTIKYVGLVWMALCVALWVYVGFFTPTPDLGDNWLQWTLPRMFADTRLGLTFVPIFLAIPGAYLWERGRRDRVKD